VGNSPDEVETQDFANNYVMKNTIIIITILTLLFIGCKNNASSQYNSLPPENMNDGLNVGTLNEVNINPKLIEIAVNKISRGKYKEVHSILIFRDNKLVLEEYFQGHKYQWDAPSHYGELVTWDRSMMHCIHSVTKSFTSICIGIAIDKGFIKSVHQSIFDYLPEYQHYKVGGKENITIEHLLTMTSGLQWDEWNAPLSSPENDQIGIWFSDEGPIDFILERPLIYEPGTHFTYSGGSMEVLGEILENATGMKIDKFSEKYMFEPLGINSFDWWLVFSSGEIHAAGGLKLTPRDMLKVGVTFLNEGIWNGTRIISEEWVAESAETYAGNKGIKIPGEDIGKVGYAYTWWTEEIQHRGEKINMFSANGWGGQKIIVIPELNTAIVFTGGNYISRVKQFKILENYVIPAIE